ncbi:hypothetical protein [Hoeflea poritis]|uniref:RNA polymerase subunit sigma-70 n=1 Tax=Hoeflea poritis TaxID=2993659 RepID=A0ABT4VVP3_9HYPH|nr:hypothetical protein [Hoeflea poritis]MDA4848779.1 hypothetical protein [Hoeflea poritis]
MQKPEEIMPPDPGDLEGWREAVASGHLVKFRPEALVAALQDLGPDADPAVLNLIAERLSAILMRILRAYIGWNHPNRGEDMILQTHDDIFAALLQKDSADGQALRKIFTRMVTYRAKDTIANEYHDSRIPLTHESKKKAAANKEDDKPLDEDKAREVRRLVTLPDPKEATEDVNGFVGDDAVSNAARFDPALFEGVRRLESTMDVERVLARIPDHRKRLAFRLFMDDVPLGSKKAFSIAEALGVSAKTIKTWIRECQEILKSLPEVRELDDGKVGERS